MASRFRQRTLLFTDSKLLCNKSLVIFSNNAANALRWSAQFNTRPLRHQARSSSLIRKNEIVLRERHFRRICSGRTLQDRLRDGTGAAGKPDGDDGNIPKASSSKRRLRDRISNLTPHENIYTIPNILTFSRLLATPVIGYLVLHDNHVWAAGLFAYAGISDLIDGWIARRWKLQTVVGSVIDPMADKALMTVLVGCLAAKGALPLWLAALIFGRDMSLGFSAIYYRYASLPVPKTFMRYWDFSIPSAEVHPTTVSKWNTFLQLGLIGSTVVTPLLTTIDMATALQGMQYLVAGTTLWSGASYLWTKDAVVILGNDEALKRKQSFRGRMVLGISFAAFLALAARLAAYERVESVPAGTKS